MDATELSLRDCLCERSTRVEAFERYRAMTRTQPVQIFVVMDGDRFLGLVGDREAALFPNRIFADLVTRRAPDPLQDDDSIMLALHRLEAEGREFLHLVDQRDEFVGVVSRFSIISALVRHERRLRTRLENLLEEYGHELEHHRIAASVFEATSEGIMVTDADERIVMVNRAFTETTGWPADEVIGKSPRLLHSGRQDRNFYQAMWKSLQEHGAWEGEIWNRRRNGEVYPEFLHVNAIRDENGAIRHYAGVFSDASRFREMREHLQHLVYYDVLTGLPNRKLFFDKLEHSIAQARDEGGEVALFLFDLDGFKEINDTLGHATGDRLLGRIGEILADVDGKHTVARLGGDEFTVLAAFPPGDDQVVAMADKLITTLNRAFIVDDHELFVAATLGISRFPEDGDDAQSLLMAADNALYKAKGENKGGYRFYSAMSHGQFVRRVRMTGELRRGLERERMQIAWQPQVDLAEGRIVGAEALARWRDSHGQCVAPDTFVPLAETTGLIGKLGRQVLERAVEDISTLHEAFPSLKEEFRFAVNASPAQFNGGTHSHNASEQTVDVIISTMESRGMKPGELEIEVTESALAGRDGMEEGLTRLGRAGIHIAIDDFGTGCSNLSTIKHLPITKVKIDRSLVTDILDDPADREIVSAVVGMCRGLNLEVLAEGVENEEQARLLHRLGCDTAQGFLFSRPLPLDEFHEFIRDNLSLRVA